MKTVGKIGCSIFIIMALKFTATHALAFDTVLPDFSGAQAEFSRYRTRISDAMLNGPNFATHFTIITIECGANCVFGYVGDNETGELYRLPFGGEENSQMSLEFDLDSSKLLVSFRDNPLIKESGSWVKKYEDDESPCAARQLRFSEGVFIEEKSRVDESYGRMCPLASMFFQVNEWGLSDFEEECYAAVTRINLCEEAKKVAQEAEATFPIRAAKDLTVLSLTSVGPRIRIIAKWSLSESEIRSKVSANNITMEKLKNLLEISGKYKACNNKIFAPFARLGGLFEFHYLDNFDYRIHSFEVEGCHRWYQ